MEIIKDDLNLPKLTKRKLTKEIILHCSATIEGKDYDTKTIDKWHKQRGFSCIGYNFIIYRNGEIHEGRGWDNIGAQCVNHNSQSIGICYIGGLAQDGKTAKDTRTKEQKLALLQLVDKALQKYSLGINDIHCHNEFAAKACPSFKIEQFRAEYVAYKKGIV